MTLQRLSGGLSANFWRLWASSTSSNLADGIMTVALPLVALQLTDSPAEFAGVTAAAIIPSLVFGLPAGGLADRLDRRLTMVSVQALRIAILGTLTILAISGALSLPAIYVAAFLWGSGETFFDTNAQSIIPDIVPRPQLVSANGRLYAAETMMNSFVGPPIGGLLVAASVPLALGGSTAGYALGVLGLLLLRGSFRPAQDGPRRRLHVDIAEGLAYLARHRLLLTLTGFVAAGRLGSGAFFAIFALFAVAPGPMNLSEAQYGLLFAMFGIGSLVGSLAAARIVDRIGRAQVLGMAQLTFGITLAVPAVSTDPIMVGVSFLLSGIAVMAWNITNVSLRQSIVPSRLLGRIHATHRFVANVAGLLGAIMGGIVGELIGLRAVFAIGAAVVVFSVLGRLVVTDARIAAAEGLETNA